MNYQSAIDILRAQRHYFTTRHPFEVEEKSRANYVTSIDKQIEHNIKSALALSYPHINFVGEEEIEQKGYHHYWLLDPIDGTQNFIKRQYPSMISLALVEDETVVFAIIYDPYFDDVYHAYKGKGAYLNDEKISVSREVANHAIVMTGTSPYNRELTEATFATLQAIYRTSSDIRRSGSACYDLVQVATGRADGYVELLVQSWDYAAGYLLVSEAGGEISDINGASLANMKLGSTSIVATNGLIHQNLLKTIKEGQ